MADVFVSYSRKDKAAAERLVAALQQRGRDAWVDWEGIAPSAEWMREIHAAIAAASAFVVLCSPHWLASAVCAREFEHALACHKRIVPVVVRDIDPGAAPGELARLNWIFARDSAEIDAGVAALVTALDTDFEWVARHTRLLVRAHEWQARDHDRSLLLRGADLDGAEGWLVQAGSGTRPEATAPQREYLVASRRDATRRRNRLAGGLGGLALIALVAAVIAVINARQARTEAAEALARQLAAQSTLVRAERADLLPRALLLATEAVLRAPTPSLEVDQALRSLLATMPRHLAALPAGASDLRTLAFSPNGSRAAWMVGEALRLWRVGDPPAAALALPGRGRVDALGFDADSRILWSLREHRTVDLYDATEGRRLRVFDAGGETVVAAAAATSGAYLALLTATGQLALFGADGQPVGRFAVDVYGSGDDPHVLIRFSADNRWLALSSVRGVRLCPVAAVERCAAPFDATLSDRSALAFSPDGRWLAVDSVTHKVSVYDTVTGTPTLRAELDMANSGGRTWLRFSADGRWLVVAGEGRSQLVVWNAGDWTEAARWDAQSPVKAIDLSPDGQRVAVATDGGITEVRSLPDGRLLATLAQAGPVAFAAGPDRVVTAGDGQTLHLWEAQARADWARLPPVDGDNFGFDAGGTMLVAAGSDAAAALARWAFADARIALQPPGVAAGAGAPADAARLRDFRLSRDRRVAWAARGEAVTAWDSATLQLQFSALHQPPIDWSRRLRELQRRSCSYRDTRCNAEVAAQQTLGSVRVAAVSPEGRFAATSRADDLLRIWQSGNSQPLLAVADAEALALSEQAAVLALRPRDEFGRPRSGAFELRVHALPGGSELARLAQADGVREAELSPDGVHLLLVSEGYVLTMLELPGAHARWQRPGSNWPLRWRFSADGQRLAITEPASQGRPEAAVVVETTSGKPIGPPIPLPDSALVLALSADGARLGYGSHRDVGVHDVESGALVARAQHAAAVVDLVFSHDGRTLASASEDGSVRLVDLDLKREIARLTPAATPSRLAFSPNDALLAVASDAAVQAFAWRGADLAREACTRVPQELAPEVWRLYLGDAVPRACRGAAGLGAGSNAAMQARPSRRP